MDVQRKLKECLFQLVDSINDPADQAVAQDTYYGGVLVRTPDGPKLAHLRLSFEELAKPIP